MPDEVKKILKYNPGEKSLKVPFIVYADAECLVGKIQKKKLCISLQVTHGLHAIHLIN